MSGKPRPCPQCDKPLREINARARSGYLLVLDQCARCGGIWFDRWELYPIDAGEVARLDPVDRQKLQAPVKAPSSAGRCPRCAIALRPFRDPVLPPDARIERCPVCEGMWLNRGELRRVKGRSPPAKRVRQDEIERLAASIGAPAKWSKVADLDAATYPLEEGPLGSGEIGSALWSTAPWIILNVLLRLLLGL